MSLSEEAAKQAWFESVKPTLLVCYHCGNVSLPRKKEVKYCKICTNPYGTKPQKKTPVIKSKKGGKRN